MPGRAVARQRGITARSGTSVLEFGPRNGDREREIDVYPVLIGGGPFARQNHFPIPGYSGARVAPLLGRRRGGCVRWGQYLPHEECGGGADILEQCFGQRQTRKSGVRKSDLPLVPRNTDRSDYRRVARRTALSIGETEPGSADRGASAGLRFGWARKRGSVPRCGWPAWTRNGWHRYTSPARPVA